MYICDRKAPAPEHITACSLFNSTPRSQLLQSWCIATAPTSHRTMVILLGRVMCVLLFSKNLCFSVSFNSSTPATFVSFFARLIIDLLTKSFFFFSSSTQSSGTFAPSGVNSRFLHFPSFHKGFFRDCSVSDFFGRSCTCDLQILTAGTFLSVELCSYPTNCRFRI